MRQNIIVVDNFYNNPDEVREFALSQEFNVTGNYPGVRTQNFLNQSTKDTLENIIQDQVVNWLDGGLGSTNEGYTGAFQFTTKDNKSWIHNDAYNNWAGVLYLTPDAPTSGGTGFFRSKIDGSLTGKDHDSPELEGTYGDYSKWDLVANVGNVYNRIVLFRADQWHTSLDYFGTSMKDGRLTQVFFFRTEQ
jgi:hypothetical protein|tara:strand:+ start:61 stop:633 length:573 start_codon:yes stop_codon:yes gene_type:complete